MKKEENLGRFVNPQEYSAEKQKYLKDTVQLRANAVNHLIQAVAMLEALATKDQFYTVEHWQTETGTKGVYTKQYRLNGIYVNHLKSLRGKILAIKKKITDKPSVIREKSTLKKLK